MKCFSKNYALALCIGLASAAAEISAASANPIDPSKVEILKRSAIPHVPFPMIDPATNKYVKEGDLIKSWNGTMVKAKDYYAKLNSLEKQLNEWGYSLKNGTDFSLIKRILLDYGLIDKNRALSEDLRALAEDGVMERLKDPSVLKKIIQDETAKRLERYVDKLYKESLNSPLGDIGMPDLTLDPALIKNRDKNLKAVIEKYYNDQWGDTGRLGAKVDAVFVVEGDSSQARVLARAQVDAYLLNNSLNIATAHVEGKVPEKGTSSLDTAVFIGGYKLIEPTKKNKDIKPAAAEGKKGQAPKVEDYLWSIGPRDFGLDPTKMNKEFREGIPLVWTWGIVSVEGEIGAYGTVGFNFDVHMANLSLTANVGPEQQIGVFAKATAKAGFGDFSVADAGVVGDVSLIKSATKLEGDARLIFENGTPIWVTKAKGYVKTSALTGSMYVFASVKVPTAALPPWTDKTFRHDIYQGGDAVDLPEMVLFNYEKRASPGGTSIFGAPKPEDTPGIDLDNTLTQIFKDTVQHISDNHNRVISSMRNQVSALESNREAIEVLKRDLR